MKRPIHSAFHRALRAVRKARGVSQEQFHPVSGRTYISSIERGQKNPTLAKVDSLAGVLDVHPLTLLTLSYCGRGGETEVRNLLHRIEAEIESLSIGRIE